MKFILTKTIRALFIGRCQIILEKIGFYTLIMIFST